MIRNKRIRLIIVISGIFAASCSNYQKILKSDDYNFKYEKAKEYYNKDDFFRSLPLFEELVNIYKGTDKAEDLYYYFAYCHFGLGDYLMARYHFKNFATTFKNSEYTEECQYMYAYCYYLSSPESSLDQSNTFKAIDAFQLFVNIYPGSDRIEKCNEYIDKLRLKLESKAYENAKLYFNIGNYKAAIIALNNTVEDYPDIDNRENIDFLVLKSNYLLAINSVEKRKLERFQSAIAAYNKFIDRYPESKMLREAESIYDNTIKNIENIKS